MDTTRTCSSCGKAIAAHAPEGLCAECLLKAGLGTGVNPGPESEADAAQSAFKPPSVAELAPLFPQLEILEFIGRGGMGAVYKARQKPLNRFVALKILPQGAGRDAAFAGRFTREAQALAQLNHPGIVTLYEFGEINGQFYFLMEFVDGVNLRQLLHAGRVAPREALAIVPQICDALQFAHDQGIVHRDIKPENILLDRRGRVKLADFGLAKLVGTEAFGVPPAGDPDRPTAELHATTLTDAGKVLGTPQYMAPEQMARPGEVDHRADIYALGVVFYQMLTGELPGKRIEPPSRKVRIDVRLDEVVLRALENEPERRYQQASILKTRLETIAEIPAVWQTADDPKHPTPAQAERGLDFRTQLSLFGLPLVHVATGSDPVTGHKRIAHGIVAIGDIARGFIAIGGVAVGWFSFGGLSLGLFSFGGLALGAVAFGGAAIGLLAALGGGAIGLISMGGGAAGYWTYAGHGRGVGVHVVDALTQDPAAQRFFLPWAKSLTSDLQWINIGALAFLLGISIGIPAWLRHRLRLQPAGFGPDDERTRPAGSSWLLSALASPEGREIFAHMTRQERSEFDLFGLLWTVWMMVATFGSVLILVLFPWPGSGIAVAVLASLFLVSLALMLGLQRRLACSTAWAREQGLRTGQVRLLTSSRQNVRRVLVFALLVVLIALAVPRLIRHSSGVEDLEAGLNDAGHRPQTINRQPGPGQRLFGPVIECVVADGAENQGRDLFLDLDTSRVLSETTNAEVLGNPKLALLWLATNGVDLQAVNQTRAWSQSEAAAYDGMFFETSGQHLPEGPLRGIVGCDLTVLPLDKEEWNSESPDSLIAALAQSRADAVRFYSAAGELPLTLGFKTREGGLGILEVTGFTEKPRGVRIRYKLARNVPPQPSPTFVANDSGGGVELLALTCKPWTNGICWRADGALWGHPFPTINGHIDASSENMDVKKIAFRIDTQGAANISPPVSRVNDESGVLLQGSAWQAPDVRSPEGLFIQMFACPTNAKTMNIALGIADGPWETAVTLRHDNARSSSAASEGVWTAAYNAVAGSQGDVAVSFIYSRSDDGETRMAYPNVDGGIISIPENGARVDTRQTGATLLISSNEFARIREFLLQRRKYHWVEFRNVALQPGYKTAVEAKDAGGEYRTASTLSANSAGAKSLAVNPRIKRTVVDPLAVARALEAKALSNPEEFVFRWVAANGDSNSPADVLPDASDRTGQRTLRVTREVVLSSIDVESAGFSQYQSEQKTIEVFLTPQGGERFAAATGSNIGRQLAIVWRGRVISAPIIRSKIPGRRVSVTGDFTDAEAQQLLNVLNHRVRATNTVSRVLVGQVVDEAGKPLGARRRISAVEVPTLLCSGTVRYASGKPAADVNVAFYPGFYSGSGDYAEVKTDRNGQYEIIQEPDKSRPMIGPINPTNSIMAGDVKNDLAALRQFGKTTTNVDLVLQPAITLSGSVRNTEGKPVPGAELDVRFLSGNSMIPLSPRPTSANESGLFSISALPQGCDYWVNGIAAKGYGSGFARVEAKDTRTAAYRFPPFVLKPANDKLAGRVLDNNGKPLAGTRVSFDGPGQPKDSSTNADSEGDFFFDAVCEGPIKIFANYQDPQDRGIYMSLNGGGGMEVKAGDTNILITLRNPNVTPR